MLERAEELRTIAGAVAAARTGHGTAVVIEGEPGIGKTALLGAASDEAVSAGLNVLGARGDEYEREFAFGIARQLLDPVLRLENGGLDSELLAGPARLASGILDFGSPGTGEALPPGPNGPVAAVHALWSLIGNLSRRGPLALLVDDAHWADLASSRLLTYVARRTADIPLVLVVALRPFDASTQPSLTALQTSGATVIHPGPLTPDGGRRLVCQLLPSANEDLCRRLHAATDGNPFLLSELALELARGSTQKGDPVVPASVATAVLTRIGHAPLGSLALARAVAVLGRAVPLRHAAALAGLDVETAAAAADALAASAVLGPGRPLEFRHSVIATAVADNMPTGERSAAHSRAARLLADEDASAEHIALHLLHAEPLSDRWACGHLMDAGRDAVRRGAPEVGIRYLRRALDEPPPEDWRGAVLWALGAAEALALQLEPAIDHLRRGLDRVQEPEERLRVASILASVLNYSGRFEELVLTLEPALQAVEPNATSLALEAEANLIAAGRGHPAARRLVTRRAAQVLQRVLRGADVPAATLAAAASELAATGTDAGRTAELSERALRLFDLEENRFEIWPYIALRCLMVAGRFASALDVLDAAVAQARELGSLYELRVLLLFRAEVALRVGALEAAECDAREVLELTEDEWLIGTTFAAALLVAALVERGELHVARSVIADAALTAPPADLPAAYLNHVLLHSRGRLYVACGDVEAGLDDLLECGRRQVAIDEPNPAVLDWRSQAALALAHLGRVTEAQRLVSEELSLARRFGAPGAIGVAERATGQLAGGADGLQWLQRAVTTLEQTSARLEYGRALVEVGAALHRRGCGRQAREALREGLALAHHCGATALADRAAMELRATGARPRRAALTGRSALTPSELRTGELAAAGRSNREIAELLHVSVRTVESHLSAVYRKLNVSSRDDLAAEILATASGSADSIGRRQPGSTLWG